MLVLIRVFDVLESTKTVPEETKKEHKPQLPAILMFYDGYKDRTTTKDKKKEVVIVEEDPVDAICAPEAHISAVVKGKLIQKSSVATQTAYDPALGSLVDHLKQEHDLRTAIALRTLSSQDQEITKKKSFLTHGYIDYREDEPSETLVNLMQEIREDLNLLRGVERYTTFRTKSEESLLTLLSDTSYLSVESYLYDSDYREGRSEEAKRLKVERKKKRMDRAFNSKKHTSFNVECWGESCGLISSDEEMPMDEFKLAKKIVADLPVEEALEYAIKYLKDRGDPMAVLPGIHRIPKLVVWYDNRRLIKSAKAKEQEKAELFEKSYHLWSKPYYKITSMITPEISIPRCVTWDWIDKVKFESEATKRKHFKIVKQQLVTNARNYFPTMFTEHYNNKLMKSFRKTFYAYMPSKEMETISFNPKPLTKDEEEDRKREIEKCYNGKSPVYKKPSDVPKSRKIRKLRRSSTKRLVSSKKPILSFAGEDTKVYTTYLLFHFCR